jgi:hypothetical protein
MGLDMYLTKKIYVGANYEHRNVTGSISIKVGKEEVPVNLKKVRYIEEEAGYWRKANAIHAWFVGNVQDGNDDCGDYYVSQKKMQELLDLCNLILDTVILVDGQIHNGTCYSKEKGQEEIYEPGKVVKNVAVLRKLLPTESGFFFGSTDYDEYYIQDIKDTKEILEEALKNDGEFYYHSSW